MKSFFSEKRGQKLGCVLYTGAHYTRVNTVYSFPVYILLQPETLRPFPAAPIPGMNSFLKKKIVGDDVIQSFLVLK